jgi:hypothetical protein
VLRHPLPRTPLASGCTTLDQLAAGSRMEPVDDRYLQCQSRCIFARCGWARHPPRSQASSGLRGRASPQKFQDPVWVYDSTCDAQTNLALELVTPVAACVGCAPPWAARALITEASRAGCHLPTRGKKKGGSRESKKKIRFCPWRDSNPQSSDYLPSGGWGWIVPMQDLNPQLRSQTRYPFRHTGAAHWTTSATKSVDLKDLRLYQQSNPHLLPTRHGGCAPRGVMGAGSPR